MNWKYYWASVQDLSGRYPRFACPRPLQRLLNKQTVYILHEQEVTTSIHISKQREADRRTDIKYFIESYMVGEAEQEDEQPEWLLKAVVELMELHSVGVLPHRADPPPEGTPEIMGRLDSHGSPGPGPTAWPGHAWSLSSDRRRNNNFRIMHLLATFSTTKICLQCSLTFISSIMSWVKTPFSRSPS